LKKRSEIKAWVAKAEQDFQAATFLAGKRKKPVPEIVCFHCQQAAEKYLKGYLAGENIPFPKTHDLASLRALAAVGLPEIELVFDLLKYLNRFSVLPRYPGENATTEQAKKALNPAVAIRNFFASRLPGIPD
jgi:HEPN domain-containing protein